MFESFWVILGGVSAYSVRSGYNYEVYNDGARQLRVLLWLPGNDSNADMHLIIDDSVMGWSKMYYCK